MSDVFCAGCREPWDSYHMRHDAVYDTDLPESEQLKLDKGDWDGKLSAKQQESFQRAGWELAGSVYAILKCPCCPESPRGSAEEAAMRAADVRALVGVMGNDPDGMVSELENLNSNWNRKAKKHES